MSVNDLPFFHVPSGSSGGGADGISPVVTVEKITDGHKVIIVDANGTKSFNVMDGERGDAGKSAYEISKDAGFKGTEAEWLESLQADSKVYVGEDVMPDNYTMQMTPSQNYSEVSKVFFDGSIDTSNGMFDGCAAHHEDNLSSDNVTVSTNPTSLLIKSNDGYSPESVYINGCECPENNALFAYHEMDSFVAEFDASASAPYGALSLAFMSTNSTRFDHSAITARIDKDNFGLMLRGYPFVDKASICDEWGYINGAYNPGHNLLNTNEFFHVRVVKSSFNLFMSVTDSSGNTVMKPLSVRVPDNVGIISNGFIGILVEGGTFLVKNLKITNTTNCSPLLRVKNELGNVTDEQLATFSHISKCIKKSDIVTSAGVGFISVSNNWLQSYLTYSSTEGFGNKINGYSWAELLVDFGKGGYDSIGVTATEPNTSWKWEVLIDDVSQGVAEGQALSVGGTYGIEASTTSIIPLTDNYMGIHKVRVRCVENGNLHGIEFIKSTT